MPRQRKPARLYWRDRTDGPGVWEIRAEGRRISTGTADRERAERELFDFLQAAQRPLRSVADPLISDVLATYAEDHARHVAAPERIGYAIEALVRFWGADPVSTITGPRCRKYGSQRRTRHGELASAGTVRRELNVLQAALNYCHAEGHLLHAPRVTLPAKPPSKERWLTRQEAAWLIRAARRLRVDGRHLAQFILHGLYTGSRKQTILAMRLDTPSLTGGHVDTKTGILYRKPAGKSETLKRQRPARLPSRYLSYLRIQARNGRRFVVQDNHGRQIGNIRNAWTHAVQVAVEQAALRGIILNLDGVTPHTLKHTAITWALQKGASTWDAAGYFSTSIETIERVYGHHSPDHQKSAVEALNRRS